MLESSQFCNDLSKLIVDEPKEIPGSYKTSKDWKKTKALFIEDPETSDRTPTLLLEDILIECKPVVMDDSFYRNQEEPKEEFYLIAGIPTARLDWILKNANEQMTKAVYCDYEARSKNLAWVVVENDDALCYVYKKKSKGTVPIGSLEQVCTDLKSTVRGYGQFDIFIKSSGRLDLFLTAFQMIDVSNAQSAPKPDVQVSPSDELLEKLNELTFF